MFSLGCHDKNKKKMKKKLRRWKEGFVVLQREA